MDCSHFTLNLYFFYDFLVVGPTYKLVFGGAECRPMRIHGFLFCERRYKMDGT